MWRWLFHHSFVRKKVWFSRPPEASMSRMIKSFGLRRVQISSSKSPMLDYTCGEHAVNTRRLNVKKFWKIVDFYAKNRRFLSIFSHLLNACWPHVPRTCNPTLVISTTLFGPFLLQTVWSYDSSSLRGVEKTIFFSLQRKDGITTFIYVFRTSLWSHSFATK